MTGSIVGRSAIFLAALVPDEKRPKVHPACLFVRRYSFRQAPAVTTCA